MKHIKLYQMDNGGLTVDSIYLGGSDAPGAVPVIKSGRMGKETVLPSGLVRQEIELQLVGQRATVEDYLRKVGALLAEAERTAGLPGVAMVYLKARQDGSSDEWRSKVYGGRVELVDGAEARTLRAQRVLVVLERADWWETDYELVVGITNGGELTGDGEAWLWNHNDGGNEIVNWNLINYNTKHCNWFKTTSAIDGDLPAECRMVLDARDATLPDTDGYNIFIGESALRPAGAIEGSTRDIFWEGAGVTRVNTPDVNSSGGAYESLTWAGDAATKLFEVTFSRDENWAYAGRPCKVFARLAAQVSGLAAERFYLTWGVGMIPEMSAAMYDQELSGGYLPGLAGFIEGPVISMPPYPVEWGAAGHAPQTALSLTAQAPAGSLGAHNLKIDELYLFPLDGWRYYRPTVNPDIWPYLEDNGFIGAIYSEDHMGLYRAEGPGFLLYPGRSVDHIFNVFAWRSHLRDGSDSHVGIDFHYKVQLLHRPRKRVF